MPHTPAIPEEAKIDVFLPFSLLGDATVRIVVARLVQMFAQDVAVPAMMRWDVAKGLNVGGRLYNANIPRQPSNRAPLPSLLPHSDTPYTTMYGRSPGSLEALITALYGAAAPTALSTPALPAVVPPAPAPTPAPADAPTPSAPVGVTTPPAAHVSLPLSPSNTPSTPTTPTGKKRVGSAVSSTLYLSPPGKSHIKMQYDPDDPWTKSDVMAYGESVESEIVNASTSSISPLRRSHYDDDLVNQLYGRISELEVIVASQHSEITRLESVVRRDDDDYDNSGTLQIGDSSIRPNRCPIDDEPDLSLTPTILPAGGRVSTPSTSFDRGKGKAPPSSTASWSSVSSVSSVTPSSYSVDKVKPVDTGSKTAPRRLQPASQANIPTASRSGAHTITPLTSDVGQHLAIPSQPYSHAPSEGDTNNQSRDQFDMTFGFYTDHALAFHDFPPVTVGLLRAVERTYPSESWEVGIRKTVPQCSTREIEDIALAMRKDKRLPTL